ncbi:MAG: hypothetical protein WCO66_03755 [Candidatus Absconditabacteria bacterium]
MNDVKKILGYAFIALTVLILISVFAGLLSWLWSKLVIGFVIATCLWIIQQIRNKPVSNGFIVWWGISISGILVAIDWFGMVIARFSWVIFVALIIGIIVWAIVKWGKRN